MLPRLPAAMTALIALVTVAHAQVPSTGPASSAPPTSGSSVNAPLAAGSGSNPIAATGMSSSINIAKADRTFATKAAQAGTAEIADAKLALQNSSRQDVKDFAQHMVDDHTKAADQLKSIAGGEGISLPTAESSADQKNTDALTKLTGAAFDKRYIQSQRKAHKAAVALFSSESKNGKDSQLKGFATQTLPTLQDHLKMVTALPLTAKNPSP
jgi:putative membrane protein